MPELPAYWTTTSKKLTEEADAAHDNFSKWIAKGWNASDFALLASGIGQLRDAIAMVEYALPILEKYQGTPE